MTYPKVPAKRNESDLLTSVEGDVNAPMDVVFDVITDFELFVELEEPVKEVITDPNVEKGKGYKSHWEMVEPGSGEKWSCDEEILYYDRPRQYAFAGRGSNGKDYGGVHTLSQNSDGSTHHVFNEVHHFISDPEVYKKTLTRLLNNVKKEAEKRYQAGN